MEPTKQRPVSQLGAGSATIEQMLRMDLPMLIAMSDDQILAYIKPALDAVPPITSRNIVTKPVMKAKLLLPPSAIDLMTKRGVAKAKARDREPTIAERLSKLGKITSFDAKQKEIQRLKDMLGEEDGLQAAEKASVGTATTLVVKGISSSSEESNERKAQLQARVAGKPYMPAKALTLKL